MSASLTLSGGKELEAALEKFGEQLLVAIDDVCEEAAIEIQTDVILRINQGPKTGRIYKRGGVVHQASAPGEAPANDTGQLQASIQSNRIDRARYEVTTPLKKAGYLEYGTRHMAPRPAWVPAIEKARPEFEAAIAREIARLTK
jgi:hypothetical protein